MHCEHTKETHRQPAPADDKTQADAKEQEKDAGEAVAKDVVRQGEMTSRFAKAAELLSAVRETPQCQKLSAPLDRWNREAGQASDDAQAHDTASRGPQQRRLAYARKALLRSTE